jgi:glycosyltransferase involved in cell wall biosynthesis
VRTPTFSIVIETENLANGDLAELERCLDSLAAQGLDRLRPNEVIIVESGQVARGVLETVRMRYPWLSVHFSSRPMHYYEAKMEGARTATGELIVLADADVRYEPGWLASLLAPFEQAGTSFVSGETRIDITGPYTFSVATTWLFPRRYAPGDAASLIGNNAAVRRDALLDCPIPVQLPLYRAQIVLHGRMIKARGLRISRVRARGLHAPPAEIREWALRYAISGADSVKGATFHVSEDGRIEERSSLRIRLGAWLRLSARKGASSIVRTVQALAERPARIMYLPVALPISVAAFALFVAGGFSAVLGSDLAHRRMNAFESAAGGIKLAPDVSAR